jgi:hypothetical protein
MLKNTKHHDVYNSHMGWSSTHQKHLERRLIQQERPLCKHNSQQRLGERPHLPLDLARITAHQRPHHCHPALQFSLHRRDAGADLGLFDELRRDGRLVRFGELGARGGALGSLGRADFGFPLFGGVVASVFVFDIVLFGRKN